ncbi:unnamed protein product [Adineta ricciae]|uniref:Uncharacterized protein n=1 Tax=Adineta ricciae TaxID=249248 RepID=A0A816DT28_ADIRI|nr:unnamed protein product [Adineta ricciae]
MTYVYLDDSTAKEKFYATDIAQEPQQICFRVDDEYRLTGISLEDAVKPLTNLIPEIVEKAKHAKCNCENPSDGLSSDESAAIYLFSMRWQPVEQCLYFVLNKTLREQNDAQLHVSKLYLRLLLAALNRLPSTRITFHQDIEHERTRRLRKDHLLVFWDFTFCSLSTPLPRKLKQISFYTKTRTTFSFECRNAKFIERHSCDRSQNEYLLLPTQFQLVRYLDRRTDLEIIQVKEYDTKQPLIDFIDTSNQHHRLSIPTQEISRTTYKIPSSNPNLERLIELHQPQSDINLTYQNLTVDDMSIIVEKAIIEKKCTRLFLDNNYITYECMCLLVDALPHNTTLKELYLRETGLYDISVQILACTLASNNCSIKALYMDRNYITDQGAGYLAEMLKTNTTLTQLHLFTNRIGKKGAKLITNVMGQENTTLAYFGHEYYEQKKNSRLRKVLHVLNCVNN